MYVKGPQAISFSAEGIYSARHERSHAKLGNPRITEVTYPTAILGVIEPVLLPVCNPALLSFDYTDQYPERS